MSSTKPTMNSEGKVETDAITVEDSPFTLKATRDMQGARYPTRVASCVGRAVGCTGLDWQGQVGWVSNPQGAVATYLHDDPQCRAELLKFEIFVTKHLDFNRSVRTIAPVIKQGA